LLITYQINHPLIPSHILIKSEEIDGLTFLKRHSSATQYQNFIGIMDSLFPPIGGAPPPNGDDEVPPRSFCRRRRRKRKRRNKNEDVKTKNNPIET